MRRRTGLCTCLLALGALLALLSPSESPPVHPPGAAPLERGAADGVLARSQEALSALWFYGKLRHGPDRTTPIGDICEDLRTTHEVTPLEAREVHGEVFTSDVVIIADDHRVPYIEHVVAELVAFSVSNYGANVALFLEAVPATQTDRLRGLINQAASGSQEPLRSFLARYWDFPVAGYVRLLRSMHSQGVRVFGAASHEHESRIGPETPDGRRRPRSVAEAAPSEICDMHSAVADAVREAVALGEGSRAFVLFGAAHLFVERCPLVAALESRGLMVASVVPFHWDLESALLERFGSSACGTWFRLRPGLYRSPQALRDLGSGVVSVGRFQGHGD